MKVSLSGTHVCDPLLQINIAHTPTHLGRLNERRPRVVLPAPLLCSPLPAFLRRPDEAPPCGTMLFSSSSFTELPVVAAPAAGVGVVGSTFGVISAVVAPGVAVGVASPPVDSLRPRLRDLVAVASLRFRPRCALGFLSPWRVHAVCDMCVRGRAQCWVLGAAAEHTGDTDLRELARLLLDSSCGYDVVGWWLSDCGRHEGVRVRHQHVRTKECRRLATRLRLEVRTAAA